MEVRVSFCCFIPEEITPVLILVVDDKFWLFVVLSGVFKG
jgi:hypothetical protein